MSVLADIPAGTRCFVDANILYYHFVETPGLSDPCSDLLQRVLAGEVVGVTSTHLLAETIHKVMLTEAAARFSLARAGLANLLQRQPERITLLTDFTIAAAALGRMNLDVHTVDLGTLANATEVSRSLGLMTNDATTVALMRRLGIADLATNDDDFLRVPGIHVWRPR